MRATRQPPWLSLCVFAVLCGGTGAVRAEPISGSSGLANLGSFTGDFTYTPLTSNSATLDIVLNNTSLLANGGYLTAFVFNNPDHAITGGTLTSSNSNFHLLGGSNYNGEVKAPPFGKFDLGASITGQFLGGGSPRGGIPAGGSATFTFSLTGHGLDALTTASFYAARSSPEAQDLDPAYFVARFRGFKNGGSDKVPGQISGGGGGGGTGGIESAPEPGTMTLAGIGIASALGYGWSRRRARRG
ncbi:MAG TPA: PEP-CTERM sorting domain-containing protein [Gemmataceae bacterium]|nr:PEP-CTERM sorting domain-containing protein [Gemmataceae bacterium]